MKAVLIIRSGVETSKPIIVICTFFCLPFLVAIFLYPNYQYLDRKKFKSKYINLYQDVSINRGRRAIMSIPFNLLQNWCIIMSSVVANDDDAIQGILILQIYVFSIIAIGKMRSHNFIGRRRLELFNVWTTMLIVYSIIYMTNFVLNE